MPQSEECRCRRFTVDEIPLIVVVGNAICRHHCKKDLAPARPMSLEQVFLALEVSCVGLRYHEETMPVLYLAKRISAVCALIEEIDLSPPLVLAFARHMTPRAGGGGHGSKAKPLSVRSVYGIHPQTRSRPNFDKLGSFAGQSTTEPGHGLRERRETLVLSSAGRRG